MSVKPEVQGKMFLLQKNHVRQRMFAGQARIRRWDMRKQRFREQCEVVLESASAPFPPRNMFALRRAESLQAQAILLGTCPLPRGCKPERTMSRGVLDLHFYLPLPPPGELDSRVSKRREKVRTTEVQR